MSWSDIYLLCFAVGGLWSAASLVLGGLHLGHSGHGHLGHTHAGHAHSDACQPGHAHSAPTQNTSVLDGIWAWAGTMINPSCAAVFLAWFGGVGYLLSRHSGLEFWLNLAIAAVVGLSGAGLLAAFLRFIQSRDTPLNPADYEMVGVLGRVSSPIRSDGVGEVIYIRDGARKLVPARSDDGQAIRRDEEVVVTRYEKGIAFVRTWEAMTQPSQLALGSESLQKETKNV